jgi:Tfp pilus assembly protein PilN
MQRSAAVQRNRLIDLNILPAELRPHRYPHWYVLGLAAVLAGCVLLIPMVTLQHSAAQETASLRDQLELITGQLQGVEMDIGRERGLRDQMAQAEQAIAELRQERASLPGAGGPLSQHLSLLYSAAPPDVRIDATSRSEKTVTASGEASSIESVIAYAEALMDSGTFSDVTITQANAGGAGLEFAVQVAQ